MADRVRAADRLMQPAVAEAMEEYGEVARTRGLVGTFLIWDPHNLGPTQPTQFGTHITSLKVFGFVAQDWTWVSVGWACGWEVGRSTG